MAIGRSILKKGSLFAKRGLQRRRKGLSMVRGGMSPLKSAAKTIAQVPGQEEGIQPVNQITKLVNNQVSKHVKNITQQIGGGVGGGFDPTAMLEKIFGGGLSQLTSFAQGLEAFKKPFEKTFNFLEKSKKLFTDFIKKLSKAKIAKGGSKRGGLLSSILKGAATLGLVAYTAWGINKIVKGKKEGDVTVVGDGTTAGPAGTFQEEMGDQLTKKETEKFNKTMKAFDKAIKVLEGQLKGRNKKPKEEEIEEEKKEEEKVEKEKESSLVGTKQTALIAGEDVPAGLDVILAPSEVTSTSKESKTETVTDKVKNFKKKVDEKKEAKKKPEGVARWLAGGVDAITGGRTDFDQQGDGTKAETVATPQDGIAGTTGKKGDEGAKGAKGPMGWLKGAGDALTGNVFDFDGRGKPEDNAKKVVDTVKPEGTDIKPETTTVEGVTPTTVEPSTTEKDIKIEESKTVSQAPEQDEPTVNTTVLPMNAPDAGTNAGGGDASRSKMSSPDVKTGANVPFLMPFDTGNIHIAHAKQTFNILTN